MAKPSQPRPASDLVANKDLPSPTQASMPKRPGRPPKFKPGHTTVPARGTNDQRAEELRQIAEFEAKGKVKKCRMGETMYEIDEEGNFINPAASKWQRTVRKRAARGNVGSVLLRNAAHTPLKSTRQK